METSIKLAKEDVVEPPFGHGCLVSRPIPNAISYQILILIVLGYVQLSKRPKYL